MVISQCEYKVLDQRLDAISELKELSSFGEIGPILKQIGDIERILARLALEVQDPVILRGYVLFATITWPLRKHGVNDNSYLKKLAKYAQIDDVCSLLENAIKENPPVVIRDGGVIQEGYNTELDEWRKLADGATEYLDKLEQDERERHGIDSLKVGYNNVHGFFIQVSRGQSHLVPSLCSPPNIEKCRALHYFRAEGTRR